MGVLGVLGMGISVVAGCGGADSDARRAQARDLGGLILDMAAGDDSVWMLTCTVRCAGDGRRSTGELGRVDAHSGRLLWSVEVSNPHSVAVGEGGVWVASFWDSTVQRLDPANGRIVATTALKLPRPIAGDDDAFAPIDIATGANGVWISTARGYVARIDPASNRVADMIEVEPKTAGALVATDDAVWLAADGLGVLRIDTNSGRKRRISIAGRGGRRLSATTLALQRASLWVAGLWAIENTFPSVDEPAIAQIDTHTGKVARTVPLPRSAAIAARDAGAIWLSGLESPVVYRLSSRSGRITATHRVQGRHPLVSITARHVWIATHDGRLRRLRP